MYLESKWQLPGLCTKNSVVTVLVAIQTEALHAGLAMTQMEVGIALLSGIFTGPATLIAQRFKTIACSSLLFDSSAVT